MNSYNTGRTYSVDQTVDTVLESDEDVTSDQLGAAIGYAGEGGPHNSKNTGYNNLHHHSPNSATTSSLQQPVKQQQQQFTSTQPVPTASGAVTRRLNAQSGQGAENPAYESSGDNTSSNRNNNNSSSIQYHSANTTKSLQHSKQQLNGHTNHAMQLDSNIMQQHNTNSSNNENKPNNHVINVQTNTIKQQQTVDNYQNNNHANHQNKQNNQNYQTNQTVTKPVQRWRVWQGRNKFYCNGRVIMSHENKYFLVTCFLITSMCAMFWSFDCRLTLWNLPGGFMVVVISVVLFLMVMTFLFITSFSDPGIIPKSNDDERNQIEKLCITEEARFGNHDFQPRLGHPPSPRIININGVEVKLKYCYTCKIFRPPRTSHCSICNNCVYRFDHHCPWVGNCVGYRNYRFFFFFLASLSMLTLYIFGLSITNLVILSNKVGFTKALGQSPVSVIEILVCFITIWSVVGLAMFHTMLSCNELTTHEDLKGQFSQPSPHNNPDNNNAVVRNPYNKGSHFKNFLYVLFSKRFGSLIDSRSYVDPKMPLENKPNYPEEILKFTSPDRVFKETTSIREYTSLYRQANGASGNYPKQNGGQGQGVESGGHVNPAYPQERLLVNTGQTSTNLNSNNNINSSVNTAQNHNEMKPGHQAPYNNQDSSNFKNQDNTANKKPSEPFYPDNLITTQV